MSETESFESVMDTLLNGFIHNVRTDELSGSYKMIAVRLDRLKAAHDREIRDTAQREYDRGYIDGQHSMDAEHRAIAMRLRALPLDGGSHENLSQIARAIYHSDWGWTQGACAALRDELVRLMGGVSDDTCGAGCCCAAADSDGDCGLQHEEVTDERLADDCGADTGCGDGGGDLHMDRLVTYDVLWNERHKAVCELRNMHLDTGSAVKKLTIALGVKWNSDNAVRSVTLLQKRLIHLLGGDQPSGIDVLRGADLSKKSVDAMSSRAEGQSQDDALMRVRLNAKTYAYQILELADILGVDVNVGDNVADIGNAVMAKARHLADECNFSTPENDMDTEDAKPNPAETSDDEIDHVSFGTRSITNGTTGQPNGTCPDDVPMASITDELREWASDRHCKGMSHTDVLNIGLIADRIDARHYLTSAVAEASTSDAWIAMSEYDKLKRQRDELRAELEELRGHSRTCPESGDDASITDELRECVDTATKMYEDVQWYELDESEEADHTVCHVTEGELLRIADHIDEQFDRICKQQEAVLQSTIDEMADEIDKMRKEVIELRKQRHKLQQECGELQEKLDEYDSTHVELPRDANDEVFRLGCTVRMVERHPEVLLTVHSMTLCDDGEWRLYAWDDKNKYSCNLSTSEFELCEQMPDTAESIVRDLSIGAVTESEAINRIEALNG